MTSSELKLLVETAPLNSGRLLSEDCVILKCGNDNIYLNRDGKAYISIFSDKCDLAKVEQLFNDALQRKVAEIKAEKIRLEEELSKYCGTKIANEG